MFAWRCFPLLGLELRLFGVDTGFPHTPGSTGSGHFVYTIVSRLGSCCKFGPLASLLDYAYALCILAYSPISSLSLSPPPLYRRQAQLGTGWGYS